MSSIPHGKMHDVSDCKLHRISSGKLLLHSRSRPILRLVSVLASTVLLLFSSGCRHRKPHPYAPPPPPLNSESNNAGQNQPGQSQGAPIPQPKGRPNFVQVGMASWYAPSGHRAADGSRYNGQAMTAAHKTLPLETIVRVTNLANNKSVLVRITDRGPFSHGRILDLSEKAAKKIDLYRMGVAKVRVEAYLPSSARVGSRWCVQTGAFRTRKDALDLKNALLRRYAGAQVIEFAGATGYWVRIHPANPDRAQAVAIMNWIGRPFPHVVPYLVRLN
ncbi:MAG: septal ring lytic transglycosylase RlpA family protein [Acidobacteriaceae bacterium]